MVHCVYRLRFVDDDARDANYTVVFCLFTSAMTNSNSHAPNAIFVALLHSRLDYGNGWSSNLSTWSSFVGVKVAIATDLLHGIPPLLYGVVFVGFSLQGGGSEFRLAMTDRATIAGMGLPN